MARHTKSALLTILICVAFFSPSLSLSAEAKSDYPVIIAFGDSLTAAGVWQSKIDSRLELGIINAGVGGHNTNDGKARFNRDVLSRTPDLVIISFGMNDSALDMPKWVQEDIFVSNLTFFITEIRKRGGECILVTPNYIDESKYYTRHDPSAFDRVGGAGAYVDSYCVLIRQVGTDLGVPVADVRSACTQYEDKDLILTDGVHCTDLGYSLYSQEISPLIISRFAGDVNLDGRVD